ncbi:o-succinylbenzoate--CoA ligase [bacterium]|nr:o-succinylbenzoate--CoA ligase [bacterium]
MYFKADISLSEKLNKIGIKDGEKIAILSGNNEEYVKLLIHIFNIGAIAVPLNPLFPLSKISNVLKSINCLNVIVDEKSGYKDIPGCKTIAFNYFVNDLENIDLRKLIYGFNINESDKTLNKYSSIIFTSGSAGYSRAVLHTFGNHYYNALGSNVNIEFKKEDCWLISLPLNHVSGFSIIFKALTGKGDIAVKPPELSLPEAVKNKKITHLSLIPSQLSGLIDSSAGIRILKKMKAILVGGAPVPPGLIEESVNLKLPIYKSYGSTEMASQITCTLRNDTLEHMKTSGRLLEHRELKIQEDGEILVRGKTLFKGYVEKDDSGNEILNKPFSEDGWFKTGDKGYMDEDGYLNICGRIDLMFVYKGENIFPEEIENAIMELEGIEDSLVVSASKDPEGQIPVAFIKSKKYFQTDFELIKKFLQKKIESFKIPVVFLRWPEEKIKTSLKPDRKEFKKIAEYEINMH